MSEATPAANQAPTMDNVPAEEADLQQGKIAISSPVGSALMGAKKGDTVDAIVPAGIIQFKILNIE